VSGLGKDFFSSINLSSKKEEDSDEKSEAELIVDIYSSLLNTYGKSLKNISDSDIEQYFVDIYSLKNYEINERLSVETVISSLRLYDKWKIKNEKYDYVDSFIKVIEQKIDVPCKVLIVDEAQDLSNAQTKIIDLWIQEFDKDIFIIAGDDDQTVHEWNGAKPDYLINFNYGNTSTYKLERTYRLPKNIANMCNEILKTIGFREEKEIYSSKKDGEIIYNPLFNLHNVPELIEKFCNSNQTN